MALTAFSNPAESVHVIIVLYLPRGGTEGSAL